MPGGRFCAGVCPHGALQDLVLLKPVKVPPWLEQALSVLPYIYLGAGVLFAATGSAFIICQYDPFVPIFRMNGRTLMVLSGAALLLLGVFVGRPYCRFLCPYGALLKLGAIVAKWRVRVTPDYCTQCRLVRGVLPVRRDARAGSQPEPARKPWPKTAGAWRWLLVLLPVLLAGGGWLGWRFSAPASRLHPTVSLAEQLVRAQGTRSQVRRAVPGRPGAGTRPPDAAGNPDRGGAHPAQVCHGRLDLRRVGRAGDRREADQPVRCAAGGRITSRTAATASRARAASSTARTNWSGAA